MIGVIVIVVLSILLPTGRTEKSWSSRGDDEPPLFSRSEYGQLLGSLRRTKEELEEQMPRFTPPQLRGGLPPSLNWSSRNPECFSLTPWQMYCGSCWAFSAALALADRFCVQTLAHINIKLSPQYLLSCVNQYSLGCGGGYIDEAWNYMAAHGVVTDACYPYVTLADHNSLIPACTPHACLRFPFLPTHSFHKYYARDVHYVSGDINHIKLALLHGPVSATMAVYTDFLDYKSGIYAYDRGVLEGYHAIRLIGYGDGYWIGANSWSEKWGERGLFNIQFGECGIEDTVVFGYPLITQQMKDKYN